MKKQILIGVLLLSFLFASNLFAQQAVTIDSKEEEKKDNHLDLYGDIRLRAEQDWDSRRFNGTFRNDRFRLRYRFRIGLTYNWNKQISLGARLRSGVAESLQSTSHAGGN